jgi:L-ribulose-5-phosphate 4-epimerase
MKVHPLSCPGILVSSHGPFVWGKNIQEAYEHAILLEYVAETTYLSLNIKPNTELLSLELRNKHFNRKNGKESYYGQSGTP